MDNNSLIPKTPDTLAVNLNALCRNSIELIQHAREIAVNQVNLVQLMTYYALGYWIVEEQQSGKGRAGYGKKVIQTLSDALNTEFGKGFSVDTLENARKFYLSYQDRISEALFRMSLLRLRFRGRIICNSCESKIRMNAAFTKLKRQNLHGAYERCNGSTIRACTSGWHSAGTRAKSCALRAKAT